MTARRERDSDPAPPREGTASSWTFLSNHGHVLLYLSQYPEARLRDVAQAVGVTERAVQKIVADLEGAGYLERSREGRRNHYAIDPERPMRHPIESHQAVRSLLALVRERGDSDPRTP